MNDERLHFDPAEIDAAVREYQAGVTGGEERLMRAVWPLLVMRCAGMSVQGAAMDGEDAPGALLDRVLREARTHKAEFSFSAYIWRYGRAWAWALLARGNRPGRGYRGEPLVPLDAAVGDGDATLADILVAEDGGGREGYLAEIPLEGLRARRRAAVEGVYLQGKTMVDMGREMGVSKQAVEQNLRLGLSDLRRLMGQQRAEMLGGSRDLRE